MKTLFALITFAFSLQAFSAVVVSQDHEHGCSLYRAVAEDEQGRIIMNQGESLFSRKHVYGLSLMDMQIDFDRREVTVQAMMNVVLNLNHPLITARAIIRESNPDFSMLINQLNRRILLLEKICISKENEIIYARQYEAPESK